MKGKLRWAITVVILAISLPLSSAWSQMRTHSGAVRLAERIEHPKELEQKIFNLTNEARRKNGLPSLEPDGMLKTKAREKSDDMLKKDYFSHTSPDGKTLKDRLQEEGPATLRTMSSAGENIYMGAKFDYSVDIRTQARLIVDGWMTSPGHRKNMLDPNFTHMGIGVAARGKECYATQIFSQKRSSP